MSSAEHHTTAAADRVPWNRLIAYGFGGLIPIALFNSVGLLMGVLGNISLGLSAFWLGVVQIIPRLWDAVSDPLMGHISDNIRTRWGRRRPFLLIGGIAVAVSFVLLWWVPKGDAVQAWFSSEGAYNWFQLGYILTLLLVFFTSCTVFEIPHGALGMEMSADYHERTRLFSAKSFLGNLFAMGTPWLFALASLEFFKGAGGNQMDGMRWVSMMIAAVLIPMSIWWFFACREPGFETAKKQEKTKFWRNMRVATSNRTFLKLTAIVFTLAMGFNFVAALGAFYIPIFYLYGGDKDAAGALLGTNGTVWAITGLVAVFPLNLLSRRLGKTLTLAIAILLMGGAQAAKIVCYDPELPYLVLIPTVMLSAGMLMFFTLGSSMLGDICDEDEMNTGTRSEGSYYSVYWWFIKMGSAFAFLVTGILIVFSQFDEKQTTQLDELYGKVNKVVVAYRDAAEDESKPVDPAVVAENLAEAREEAGELGEHLDAQAGAIPVSADHYRSLLEKNAGVSERISELAGLGVGKEQEAAAKSLLADIKGLFVQSPVALRRLLVVEIGLPILLCVISLLLLRLYPLSEKRAYEIKAILEERKAAKEGGGE